MSWWEFSQLRQDAFYRLELESSLANLEQIQC